MNLRRATSTQAPPEPVRALSLLLDDSPGVDVPLVVIPGLDGHIRMPAIIRRRISDFHLVGLANGARASQLRKGQLDAGPSMSDIAAAYADVIGSTFAAPINVLGASTGGSIALQLAVDHPELVHRLVLVSSAHRLSEHGRHTQRRFARLLTEHQPRRASALLMSNVAVSSPARTIFAAAGWLAPGLVVRRNTADLTMLLGAEDSFDLTESLPSVAAPTLIIAGARDRFYSTALYQQLAQEIPDASLHLTRSGHLSLNGHRRLARHVLNFLDENVEGFGDHLASGVGDEGEAGWVEPNRDRAFTAR